MQVVMKGKATLQFLFPVLFCFFLLGICDVVGVSVSYLQRDFQLSDSIAGIFPVIEFIGFLFLSVPFSLLSWRIGYRTMALWGMALLSLALLLPWFWYNFSSCLLMFFLLGVGYVALQSILPFWLLRVVAGHPQSAVLTTAHLVKGMTACYVPFVAVLSVNYLGGWYYVFPLLGMLALLCCCCLWLLSVRQVEIAACPSAKEVFGLLTNRTVLAFFVAVVCAAGIDVGMNVWVPKLLMERCGHSIENAVLGSSVYFAFKILGTFASTILLVCFSAVNFYRMQVCLMLLSVLGLFFVEGEYAVLMLSGLIGLGCSCLFVLSSSLAMHTDAEHAGSLSVLMMAGMSGGACVPWLMGCLSHGMGQPLAAMLIILVCILYLLFFSLKIIRNV